jgi:hypothetical protein
MIYRILCNGSDDDAFFLDVWNGSEWPAVARERLMGVFAAGVPADWKNLDRPDLQNKRARFFFTEKGWRLIGRFVVADARQDGRVIRVFRRKNPNPSEIAFQDELQVAILPRKGIPRKKRK